MASLRTARSQATARAGAWPLATSLVPRCLGSRIAVFTVLWGVLASLTSPRTAIAIACVLILATPLLLPRPRRRRSRSLSEPAVIPNPLA